LFFIYLVILYFVFYLFKILVRRVEFEKGCLVVAVSFCVYKSGGNGNQPKDDVLSWWDEHFYFWFQFWRQ